MKGGVLLLGVPLHKCNKQSWNLPPCNHKPQSSAQVEARGYPPGVIRSPLQPEEVSCRQALIWQALIILHYIALYCRQALIIRSALQPEEVSCRQALARCSWRSGLAWLVQHGWAIPSIQCASACT